MRRIALVTATLALAFSAPMAEAKRRVVEPVVVELFTAQGCADCLDAHGLILDLADKPQVIALTFSVDYWDYLGWRDTFARPEFAQRQESYKRVMNLRDVYTPQVVVDGRLQLSGVERDRVEAAVRERAGERTYPPEMAFRGADRVAVGSGRAPRGGAVVWLVRYDPEPQEVTVRRGENKGQTVRQSNVVRELVKLGAWHGRPALYRLPETEAQGLRTVVLVQSPHDGRILAAARDG